MGIMDRRQKLSITFMHSIMDVMKNAMIISINWLITFWLYGYKKMVLMHENHFLNEGYDYVGQKRKRLVIGGLFFRSS